MIRLEWDQDNRREVATAAEVVGILRELHACYWRGEPQLVAVELVRSGDCLTIGVGRERSVMCYMSGTLDPPYYSTRGDVGGGEPVAFMFNRSYSEFPMLHTVDVEVAFDVMAEFCSTATRSSKVAWEMD